MITLEEAIDRIAVSIQPLSAESIPTRIALGRVTATPVVARLDLPVFDNSAMDGYAVRSTDLAHADATRPVELTVLARAAAGSSSAHPVTTGGCVRVFTGSTLPAGADAVVMQEDTRPVPGLPDRIAVLTAVKPWENVRLRGEDVRSGETLLPAGMRLTATRLALLEAAGTAQVQCTRRPRVAIIATGDELREPGASLDPGCIYESNRQMIAALVFAAGAEPHVRPLVPDRLEATRDALLEAYASCDAVITSGGASVGDLDLVKPAFEAIGGTLAFWRVAIRPGKPFVFGRYHDKVLLGLPGNPVSAFVTCLLLVQPALLRLQGHASLAPVTVPGILTEPLRNPGDRRHFVRVTLDAAGLVRSAGMQASHRLSSLAEANALLDLPPGADLAVGTHVAVIPFPSLGNS